MDNIIKTITTKKNIICFSSAIFLSLFFLSSCTPTGVVLSAGATAGVAAYEERGIKGAATDLGIRVEINNHWLDAGLELYNLVNLQIYEGRVLLTGHVPNTEMSDRAVRLAWQPGHVREVINEIQVSRDISIETFARDALINARLDSALLFAKNIQSINYSTRSVIGTIYLIGIAKNQEELNLVLQVARNIPDVKNVISHVLLNTDPRRLQQPSKKMGGKY
jgi:osmotically-inducible protein OsmY